MTNTLAYFAPLSAMNKMGFSTLPPAENNTSATTEKRDGKGNSLNFWTFFKKFGVNLIS
jgi:hypothetical protein